MAGVLVFFNNLIKQSRRKSLITISWVYNKYAIFKYPVLKVTV